MKIKKEILDLIELIKLDKIPQDHPLIICDRDSPQFESTIREYVKLRTQGKTDHNLLKGCEINFNDQ